VVAANASSKEPGGFYPFQPSGARQAGKWCGGSNNTDSQRGNRTSRGGWHSMSRILIMGLVLTFICSARAPLNRRMTIGPDIMREIAALDDELKRR
jgi:hypothetical protein